jgi:hypothetical protein
MRSVTLLIVFYVALIVRGWLYHINPQKTMPSPKEQNSSTVPDV